MTLLLAVVIIVVIIVMVEARMKSPAGSSEYYCEHSDPICICIAMIGDEEACSGKKTTEDPDGGGGEETTTWNTECAEGPNGAFCVGITTCPDGTRLTCIGEFQAQADEAGVRCTDSGGGGALADQAYCND